MQLSPGLQAKDKTPCGALHSFGMISLHRHLTHLRHQDSLLVDVNVMAPLKMCLAEILPVIAPGGLCGQKDVLQLWDLGCRWHIEQPSSRGLWLWPGGAFCSGLWNLVGILIIAGAKWVLACYCGEYWWLDDCISNCCSFLDTQHCSIRSRALRLASKHWFGFAEAIYKISHQATCGWLTWPHHKMRTSLSCLVCVAWGCFPVQSFYMLIFFFS